MGGGAIGGERDGVEGDGGRWVKEAEADAGDEEAGEGTVEVGLGEETGFDGGGEGEVGVAAVGVGAGEDGDGGGVLGIRGVDVRGLHVEVVDGAAVRGDEALEVPVRAEDLFEE